MTTFYEQPPTAYEVMSQVARWIAVAGRCKIIVTIVNSAGSTTTETIDRRINPAPAGTTEEK